MPTLRDRRFASRMRRMVVHWFEQPQNAALREDGLLLSGTWAAFRERTLRDPTFDASGRCTRQGGWSGTAAYLAVASRWGIDIVCWDKRHLDSNSSVRIVRRFAFQQTRRMVYFLECTTFHTATALLQTEWMIGQGQHSPNA